MNTAIFQRNKVKYEISLSVHFVPFITFFFCTLAFSQYNQFCELCFVELVSLVPLSLSLSFYSAKMSVQTLMNLIAFARADKLWKCTFVGFILN